MQKNYDQIATVDIEIASPIVDETSFGNILIVGPAPAVAPTTAPSKVAAYSNLAEVEAAGWVATGASADPVGIAAMVAFAQSPKPGKIFIAVIQTSTPEGSETPVAEEPVDTVKRAMDTDGWYVVTTAGVATNKLAAIATYIETTEKMFFYTELAAFSSGAITPTCSSALDRTVAIFPRESTAQADADIPIANKYMSVAFAACCLGYESGTETFAFKQLKMMNPASLSTAEVNALKASNINYFINVGGKNITMLGKVLSGEWIDVIRFRDWLKNDMQVRVANLFIINPKIKLNNGGITLIQNQMLASLKEGQTIGGIAEDEFDSDGNAIPGYSVSVPDASTLTDSEKASRSLDGFTFTARIAGAIHFVAIEGRLTYSL